MAIRATVTEFGPTLLAKVLGLNETQESSLGLIYRFCDEKGLALIDLEDLRAALAYLTGPGKAELKTLGGISSSTAGVLLRKVSQLEAEGGDVFFGEPAFDVADLLRAAPDGRGIVSVLDLVDVARRPALFSTFLMWVLAELFECLPEVGDPEKPSLVFFFDEAHLLFDGASDSFLDAVAQTVRLIRSKGVGVFFITQLPTDVPDEVLAQLGHRVQHAVRAFTPKDARALKSAVETFPVTEHYELAETLQSLGVGEAAVTVLDPRGVPTPVAATRLYPPRSRMTPLTPEERAAAIAASPLRPRYAERLDRDSAAELLEARIAGDAARVEEVRSRPRAEPAPPRRREPEAPGDPRRPGAGRPRLERRAAGHARGGARDLRDAPPTVTMTRRPRARRSCHVVPGSSPRMLEKAAGLEADEVILDLEDSVAPGEKGGGAREAVVAALRGGLRARTAAVRVNAVDGPHCHRDLVAVARRRPRSTSSCCPRSTTRATSPSPTTC